MLTKMLSEFIGTLFLVMVVLGSGVMGENLFPSQLGLALLVNSLATGAGLYTLIKSFSSISLAHFNPVVSTLEYFSKRLSTLELFFFILAQMSGAYLGVLLVHLMFNLSPFVISEVNRSGNHLLLSEFIATFGLIGVIKLSEKAKDSSTAFCVACYIGAGYWFTSSTALTNPAVCFARLFTNTFGGMAPAHFFPMIISQLLGASFAWLFLKKMYSDK
jgi:glycerol uptake facilitator-like aquaporin